MTRQNPVSLQIPVLADQIEAVTALLNRGENPSQGGGFFPLDKIPSVHFARWIVIPATKNIEASLVYAANIDGSPEKHLEDIVDNLAEDLDQILTYCKGYPSGDELTRETRLVYVKKHLLFTQGFYTGAPNRSVQQIKNEARLYKAVKGFVKENKGKWTTAKEASTSIKEFLANDPQWDWARKPYSLPKVNYVKLILLVLLLLLLLPLLLVFVVLIHFFYELRAKPFGKTQNQIPSAHLTALKNQEDIIYQNQLSQVFELKGGLRKLGLKFFLWATSYGARHIFVKGQLMGTPTIHFARWVIIDGGKRFVFFSNFDGSFDEYLGDFVDNNGWGLNLIYGAAKGYPRTFFMVGRGSYRIAEFMGWGRLTQVPTPIWYSAYPWDGLQQIVDRSKLRTELFNSGELTDAKTKEMLRRI